MAWYSFLIVHDSIFYQWKQLLEAHFGYSAFIFIFIHLWHIFICNKFQFIVYLCPNRRWKEYMTTLVCPIPEVDDRCLMRCNEWPGGIWFKIKQACVRNPNDILHCEMKWPWKVKFIERLCTPHSDKMRRLSWSSSWPESIFSLIAVFFAVFWWGLGISLSFLE